MSDGSSCVFPDSVIMVGVWFCFLIRHGTTGSKEGRIIGKEIAGSTLVLVDFSEAAWKWLKQTVTFAPWTGEKIHQNHVTRRTLLYQKQLNLANQIPQRNKK